MSLHLLFQKLKGGPGSGNWGHAGRPGSRGGSAPKSGLGAAMSLLTGPTAKQRQLDTKNASKVTPEVLKSNTLTLDKIEAHASLGGVSESYLAHVENDGDVIVKPDGTSFAANAQAEVAAYEVSKALGWDIVPITVIRDAGTYQRADGTIADRQGSAQQWIPNAKMAVDMISSDWKSVDMESMKKMRLLDKLIANTDRHTGNYLVKNNKVIAIDHGLSFKSKFPASTLPLVHFPEKNVISEFSWTEKDIAPLRKLLSSPPYSFYENLNADQRNYVLKSAQNMINDYEENWK